MRYTHREPSTGIRRVLVLAPYFSEEGTWIDDFCVRPDLEFRKAPYPVRVKSWHARGARTPLGEWWEHLRYVREALKWRPDCIVTSFPQLALVASALLMFGGRRNTALVAWNFNLGSMKKGWIGMLAGQLLVRVDRFVVHARSETVSYARWLRCDEAKFRFVPLQRGELEVAPVHPISGPYVVSMGSANRDYPTLVQAVLAAGIKTVIIAKPSLLSSLPDHPLLVKLSGLAQAECNAILAGARANVVPLLATRTASGQVTFITSMRMGIPTIATDCVGSVDYIEDGVTGFLVPPGDAEALSARILMLLRNDGLALRIGNAGQAYAERHLSDEAAGGYLSDVIDEVLSLKGHRI